MHGLVQFGQVVLVASGEDLDMAVFGIANPAPKVEFSGFAMDKPAKTNALDAAFDEVIVNHWFHAKCCRGWGVAQGGRNDRELDLSHPEGHDLKSRPTRKPARRR